MTRKLLVADLLCGAGGSSTGCRRALTDLGLQMELVCVNHWPVAIDTHRRNFPEARHYVQDIATVRPHLLVPEGYLDLLMASPTCTYHSVARGGKPTSDQQRSDPWHIITWLTELDVRRIIIENVWEFTGWGPVDPRTGKPIKARRGEYFHAWVETIKRLGFEPEWRKLNAADFGDATTRQRMILMARSDGRKVSWPMPTHRKPGSGDLFAVEKPWRPAREIIDWRRKGKSIFRRKKPLAPKTLARIHAGAVKFGWPEPFLVILRNHMDGMSVEGPLPTILAEGTHIGLAEPIICGNRTNNTAKLTSEPVGGITTTTGGGQFLAEPVILSQHSSGAARPVGQPLPTIMPGGAASERRQGCARPMLVEPFILSQASGGAPRGASHPIPTTVTGGGDALIVPYYGRGSGETCTTADQPLPSPTTKDRFGMVVPITHADASNRARDAGTDPLPTLTTANRGELALVEATPEYDILFRMLEPPELAAAMGLSSDGTPYKFAGTKTQQIRQIGNAVSGEKMRACVKALVADALTERGGDAAGMLEAAE